MGRRTSLSGVRLACCSLVVLAALTACSGSGDSSAAPGGSSASARPAATSSPPSTASPGSATPTASADGTQPVTISFGGDVHFASQVAGLLKDPATSMASLRPRLSRSDIAMVNLETALTQRGSEQPKQFHFRAPPTALTALQSAGVDVVTMANNHAVDYGEPGLKDTLAAKKASPIPIVGIGGNAKEAYAPAVLDVRGTKVAVIGATQVPDWTLATWPARANRPGVASAASRDLGQLVKAVTLASKRADVVVVYLHWGTDYTTCPNALQQKTARMLSWAGADIIVGAHAHRLQGAGYLRNVYVDYGLGNFVWWRRNSAADATTGVLTLSVTPAGAENAGQVTRSAWQPMMVTASGLPEIRSGATGSNLLKAWTNARTCTGLTAKPS